MSQHTVADASRVGKSPLELAVDLVREGTLSVDDEGRVWRHYTYHCGPIAKSDIRKKLSQPRRIDHPQLRGYLRFQFKHGNKMLGVLAHRLVWVLHHGPIPEGMEVNHKDTVKTNNRLSNLELLTPIGNREHARAAGRPFGAPRRIDDSKREAIVALRKEGIPGHEVARRVGVSEPQVRRIFAQSLAASSTNAGPQ
jgi:hypothetical protein